jgi:hypothetical protein
MPVLRPTPPDDVTRAYEEGLRTLLSPPIRSKYVGDPALIPTRPDVIPAGTNQLFQSPQQVYVLGLSHLECEPDIKDARFDSWRLFTPTNAGKTAFTRIAHRHGKWKLTALFYGVRVPQLLKTTTDIDQLPAVQKGDFEFRVLAIPSLNKEYAWLSAKTPDTTDVIVPLANARTLLVPDTNVPAPQSLEVPDFLSTIASLVKKRMSARGSEVG